MSSDSVQAPAQDSSGGGGSWLATRWTTLGQRIAPHRSRIARLMVVILLLAVFAEIAPSIPRDADLEFALGPDHGDIVQIRLGYVQDGEVFHSVRFDYSMGAPASIVHRPSLPSGDFQVRVELQHRDGRIERVTRPLVSPVEGRLRLQLGPAPVNEPRKAAGNAWGAGAGRVVL